MNEAEVAWLAGIYEGEGSCTITTGRAIRVEIVMTDQDIVNRVQALTGFGSVNTLAQRNEKYKTAYRWSIGSIGAVTFLQTILPWLGERRSERAKNAIDNWTNNKKQSSKGDSECIHGHAYDAPGNKRTKSGGCHLCHLAAARKCKQKKKLLSAGSSPQQS
jgi:hypothetical protein